MGWCWWSDTDSRVRAALVALSPGVHAFSSYTLLWNSRSPPLWLGHMRFGIVLGLPFPGDKRNQKRGLVLLAWVGWCSSGHLWVRLFPWGNGAPCFVEKGFVWSSLGCPTLGVALTDGVMVGKVSSSCDSTTVMSSGPRSLWGVFWASAEFFLGLTSPSKFIN